ALVHVSANLVVSGLPQPLDASPVPPAVDPDVAGPRRVAFDDQRRAIVVVEVSVTVVGTIPIVVVVPPMSVVGTIPIVIVVAVVVRVPAAVITVVFVALDVAAMIPMFVGGGHAAQRHGAGERKCDESTHWLPPDYGVPRPRLRSS